ncbi:S-protein homolog 3-like [Lycium ferocissimum]|uniref:S-protein homolog 3-like n=1 Tax=Lycium ferocissimum TaxID=112874 RepID=UPI0028168BE6|nr:S-protein homolog 3-like [Lycium ferocissimum]
MTNSALTAGYTVHVIDDLSNNDVPLSLRCQSKDNDLGVKTLKVGDDFHFSFHWSIVGETRFYCHYYWGSKQQFFDVINRGISNDCKRTDIVTNHYDCFWKVHDDGFYFSSDNSIGSYSKKYDWN